jgi:hypothetical protein
MPQRNRRLLKSLLPLGLLAMAIAIVRRRPDDWEYEVIEADAPPAEPARDVAVPPARPARRIALAAAFTTLFFAGASFTAGAGDQMVKLMEDDAAQVEAAQVEAAQVEAAQVEAAQLAGAPEAPASEAGEPEAPAPEAPAPDAPAPEAPAPEAPAPEAAAPEEAPEAAPAEVTPAGPEAVEPAPATAPSTAAAQAAEPTATEAAVAPAPANVTAPAAAPAQSTPAAPAAKPAPAPAKASGTKQWVVERAAEPPAAAPEVEHQNDGPATVWLNRALPDPTPASARLSRPFARQLVAASKRHGADWAAVLGILRAQGERGAAPATAGQLDTLAARVGKTKAWNAALALSGRTGFADRAQALADLYRFVGVETLVTGYAAAKDRLAKKVLNTPGILIYDGGRNDIVMGRIDVRILTLVGYLAQRHGSVTVSSLFSGHRFFSRPGVVSAHTFGHAVDVAAVGGTPIYGNQQPGGLTEAAVRSVLLLPSELQPRQVISLLGLGGPSFPMRDHGDHIHVGY